MPGDRLGPAGTLASTTTTPVPPQPGDRLVSLREYASLPGRPGLVKLQGRVNRGQWQGRPCPEHADIDGTTKLFWVSIHG